MKNEILILPGDGIGPEVINEAVKVIKVLQKKKLINSVIRYAKIGGYAIDTVGLPLPNDTLKAAKASRSILLGAVGGHKWDNIKDFNKRPEYGLLKLRKSLKFFANLRHTCFNPQVLSSSIKSEKLSNVNILLVRELSQGIYFGKPRGVLYNKYFLRHGYNTSKLDEKAIRRIGIIAFEIAKTRKKKFSSVDKANVLEVSRLWREIISDLAKSYPEVKVSHMYVDNAAMQIILSPKIFDVIVTGNMFGDIISDEAANLTGSIGMLPSASINSIGQSLFEPCHGSAPDIENKGIANPIATILSVSMMLHFSLQKPLLSKYLNASISNVLKKGFRTADIKYTGIKIVSTKQMGDLIIEEFEKLI
ncbi:3-isopropylmalate dehydrogenase [Candidatus Portiera aleyrodidarum]|uniref:3-isopropylmalate dehydrogenase n=1 Tax=Candidatus Portiera aleyrodidarum TaxID=91844 RepID=UPI00027E642B|nr:3-isopropylmalate dehydrogenase [Candidatus Portiera aleyrodidarum]AFS18776.1 3-isopropylmalate dehydrogenase [Candidatus Portiera aleyrodidarum BT-QVLC]